jgi:plastocyanin
MWRASLRPLVSLLAAGAIIGSAVPAAAAASPTTWQMNVGAQAERDALQVNGFLPRSESINVGDTVKWTVRTDEFHTITFLSGAPKPPLILPGPPPSINPAAAAPAGGPTYGGTGIRNSGILVKDQTYSLTFTAAGDFPFLCLIHTDMVGTIHVSAAGTPYPHTQRYYDRQGARAADRLLDAARALREEGLDVAASEPDLVVAGTGALLPGIASLFVPRFLPERKTVKVGGTITWNNIDPETPHTVTFGPEPPGTSTNPLASFAPSGTDRAGHATINAPNQAVNSGFIGTGLPFGAQFSVTFTRPGTYTYLCTLHDEQGMVGVVQVLPADRNERDRNDRDDRDDHGGYDRDDGDW